MDTQICILFSLYLATTLISLLFLRQSSATLTMLFMLNILMLQEGGAFSAISAIKEHIIMDLLMCEDKQVYVQGFPLKKKMYMQGKRVIPML